MARLHYDYLLHATVSEDWGHPAYPTAFEDVAEEDLVDRLLAYRRNPTPEDRRDYKDANYALAVLEARRLAVVCTSRPFAVQVSQTEKCNLSCVYCRPTVAHHSTRVLDSATWHDALPVLLEPALELIPYCWGEPLMAPDFPGTCEAADRFGATVSLITNLHNLDPDLACQFVRGVTRALISVDTADPELFARLRAGGSLARLERSLRMLRSAARAEGRTLPWLGVSAVLLPETLPGLPDLARWAADQGLRGVSARRAVLRNNLPQLRHAGEIGLESPIYGRALDSARQVCDQTGLFLNMADPDDCPGRDAMCPCPWHHVYLSASAKLSKCCFSHQSILGDVPTDEEYWNGPEFLQARRIWTPTFRCPECSSLDFVGRLDVSLVRGY